MENQLSETNNDVNRTLLVVGRDQGEERAEAIIQVSVGMYEEIMEIIRGSYIPEDKFLRTHEVAMAVAVKHFKRHMKISDDAPEVKKEIEANFNEFIEQAKAKFLKQNEETLEEFNTKKQQILEKTLATFSEKISHIVEQQDGLPQKLSQIRDERNKISARALEDVEQLDEATLQLVLAFKKELKAKLDEIVQNAKALIDQVIQNAIDNFQNTVQSLREKIISPGSCSQALRTAKEDVMQNVSTSLSQINTPNLQFHLDHLSSQVEALLVQALRENNAKHQDMMVTLKRVSKSSLKVFEVAGYNIFTSACLEYTEDWPSSLLKAENEALESFDSAVAGFPQSETDLIREELCRALEKPREMYRYSLESAATCPLLKSLQSRSSARK